MIEYIKIHGEESSQYLYGCGFIIVMKKATPISCDAIKKYSDSYNSDVTKKALTNIYSKTSMGDLAYNPVESKKMQFRFSVDIKTMSATNQRSSGRCWLFAATNILREIIAKKINVDSFELSQSHLAFWDKFERANYFLESVIDTAHLPTDDRTVAFILSTGVHDGGQWDMFVNIVNKYGIMPKDAMPETQQTSNTSQLNGFINRSLKKSAAVLRGMIANGASVEEIEAKKQEYLDRIYSFLCECYTEPPKEFDFEYFDKDKKYNYKSGYTALSFRDEMIADFNFDDYISIINAPTADKPFDNTYTVRYLGNIIGGNDVKYLNLSIEELKDLVRKQLEDGEIVWFGSDCGKYSEGTKKQWDDNSYDYELLTGFDLEMTKAEMLDYGFSQMNHAMVITGVNIGPDGNPNRWKIQNSWGADGANSGYHMASDTWFEKFVYQAVINKKHLGDKLALLDKTPIELNPWDPMGSLAD